MDAETVAALALLHNPWGAEMYRNSALTLTGGNVVTTYPFDTVNYDPNGNLTTGTNAAYTVPVDGYYSALGFTNYSPGATGDLLYLTLFQNSSEARRGDERIAGVASGTTTAYVVVLRIPCLQGDTLQIKYSMNTGRAVTTGNILTYAQFSFVAPR